MPTFPKLYRKRFIPNEIIYLKEDKIITHTDTLLVTKWTALKPRPDISHGISAYFADIGIKVSKIFNKENQLVHWYCDIIHTLPELSGSSIIFEDLLIDVIITADGSVKIVDMGEAAFALETGIITKEQMIEALKNTDLLLSMIYNGSFAKLQHTINQYENN